MKLDDLKPGMELQGTVLNVVDFGAFVDIGISDSALIHISKLADQFIRDPQEVVSVGDFLKVWVIDVDKERRRVSLTAIDPTAARRPRERREGRPRRSKPQQQPSTAPDGRALLPRATSPCSSAATATAPSSRGKECCQDWKSVVRTPSQTETCAANHHRHVDWTAAHAVVLGLNAVLHKEAAGHGREEVDPSPQCDDRLARAPASARFPVWTINGQRLR